MSSIDLNRLEEIATKIGKSLDVMTDPPSGIDGQYPDFPDAYTGEDYYDEVYELDVTPLEDEFRNLYESDSLALRSAIQQLMATNFDAGFMLQLMANKIDEEQN